MRPARKLEMNRGGQVTARRWVRVGENKAGREVGLAASRVQELDFPRQPTPSF